MRPNFQEIAKIWRTANGYVLLADDGSEGVVTVHLTRTSIVTQIEQALARLENPPPTGEGKLTPAEIEDLHSLDAPDNVVRPFGPAPTDDHPTVA